MCATLVDQSVAILIPVRQANLVHTAVLFPEKKRRTPLFALTAQPWRKKKELYSV